MTKQYRIIGVGNAIVDVISTVQDKFLTDNGIEKGIMQLIDAPRAKALYEAMPTHKQAAGGSVANTIAALGQLGVKTGFIGRIAADDQGRFFAGELKKNGVAFLNKAVKSKTQKTSSSMIFVSPDGERSMNTYLGISTNLGAEDLDREALQDTDWVFLEGYLFDKSAGKAAFHLAVRTAKLAGAKIGLSLSDPFCVERHREDFLKLVGGMNFVIGNEAELKSLYGTDNLDTALEKMAKVCPLVACTCGGDGVVVMFNGRRKEIPVKKIDPVDTTGAGDAFAAGFIYGVINDLGPSKCARIGNALALDVIQQIGPRTDTDLNDLLTSKKLVD